MSQAITSTRELINILDSAEINAKEIASVKDVVNYLGNEKDKDGNEVTLSNYIYNEMQALKIEVKGLKQESKNITADYVKSQCDKTHVMVERQALKDLVRSCSNAYDEADSVEYDAEETENYARSITGSLSDCKSAIDYVKEDIESLAFQDMPEEEEKEAQYGLNYNRAKKNCPKGQIKNVWKVSHIRCCRAYTDS